ncbi:hypothetical protein XOCgx_2243 [Xanthomonas oryzae pv. oryzicola]|nr:hypothetical protein XOCgx_2243 [Xanthomonas oryzae pv. oryzicola]
MGNHYLPQHYLNGFTFDDRFWVYDLEQMRSRESQPKEGLNNPSNL